MTESDVNQIIKELRTVAHKVDSIYQGLYGLPDTEDNGMCGEFKELQKDYIEFKRKVFLIVGLLVGGGLLGTGIINLLG